MMKAETNTQKALETLRAMSSEAYEQAFKLCFPLDDIEVELRKARRLYADIFADYQLQKPDKENDPQSYKLFADYLADNYSRYSDLMFILDDMLFNVHKSLLEVLKAFDSGREENIAFDSTSALYYFLQYQEAITEKGL